MDQKTFEDRFHNILETNNIRPECVPGLLELIQPFLQQGQDFTFDEPPTGSHEIPKPTRELRFSLKNMLKQSVLLLRLLQFGFIPLKLPDGPNHPGMAFLPKDSPLNQDKEFLAWLQQQGRWEIIEE